MKINLMKKLNNQKKLILQLNNQLIFMKNQVEKELKITNQSTIIILEKRKEGRKLKQMLIINIIKFFIFVFFNLFIFIKIYFLNKFLLFTIKEFEKIINTFEGIQYFTLNFLILINKLNINTFKVI